MPICPNRPEWTLKSEYSEPVLLCLRGGLGYVGEVLNHLWRHIAVAALLSGGPALAQISAPPFVRGPDKTLFVLVTDAQGNPVLVNGQPSYEAEIEVEGGRRLKMSANLKQIEALKARQNLQEYTVSPWAERSLQIQLGGDFLSQILEDFRQNPADLEEALSGMSNVKSQLIRQLLFSDRMVLEEPVRPGSGEKNTDGFIDLHALRTSVENPDPPSIIIPIEIEDPPGKWEWIMRWFVEIELRHLSFEIESKAIEFDPLTNSLVFRIGCTGARVSGPTTDVGKVRVVDRYGFWRYHDENYLVRGEVGPLDLEIRFQLFKDTQGLWRLELLRTNDQPSVKLIPRDHENPSVQMVFKNPVKDRKTGKPTNESAVPLTPLALDTVNKTLGATLESALGSAFFAEDLGTRLELKNPWDPLDRAETFLEWRLNDFRFAEGSVWLQMDSRLLIKKAANCARDFVKAWNNKVPLEGQGPLPALSRDDTNKWSLSTTGQGNALGPWVGPQTQKKSVSVKLNASFLDLLMKGSVTAGLLCPQTRWIWPRDGSLPPVEVSLQELPKIELKEGSIELSLAGRAVLFGLENAAIPQFQKSRELLVRWKPELRLLEEKDGLWLGRFSEMNIQSFRANSTEPNLNPSTWNRDEVDFLLGLVEGAVEGSQRWQVDALRWSWKEKELRLNDQSPWAWTIEGASINPTQFSVELSAKRLNPADLVDQADEDQNAKGVVPRSLERPVSQFSEDLALVIREPGMEVRWGSQVPEAYYSWRLRFRGDGNWGPWSNFSQSTSTHVATTRSGLYEVQVIGMNSFFEMEEFPKQFDFRVNLPTPESRPESVWKEAEPSDGSKQGIPSSEANLKKAKSADPSKGPFGCVVRLDGGVSEGFWRAFVSLGLLALAFVFLRSQPLRLRI